MIEDKDMSVVEHLTEIRKRIVIILIFVVTTSTIVYINVLWLIQFLLYPIHKFNVSIVYYSMIDGFMTRLKVSLFAGVILMSPLILYHIIAFFMPGLTKKERRMIGIVLSVGLFSFISGVLIGYLLILPIAMNFLIATANNYLSPGLSGSMYFSFIGVFCLVCGGICSAMPILFFLGKIGVITSKQMKKNRKFLFIIALFLQGMLGYTGEIISSLLIIAMLFLLYEITIFLLHRYEKKKEKQQ